MLAWQRNSGAVGLVKPRKYLRWAAEDGTVCLWLRELFVTT